jgi:branched-chain amino acid transport system ATP-binding protein
MLIEANALTKRFGGLNALDAIDIAVGDRELLGVIGPNGAGKTTLFDVLTGVVKPTSGRVTYAGEDITGIQAHRMPHLGIFRTFQRASVFRELTTTENLIIGRHVKIDTNLFDDLFLSAKCRKQEEEAREKANQVLNFIGIQHLASQFAGTLSYGNQKLLSLGVALMGEPKVLLLDEPAAGMNPTEINKLMTLVKELKKSLMTIIVVEHDMKFIMDLCERIVVLNFGSIIAQGTPQEVSHNEDVIRVYLGNKATKRC